jgi:hypothetical protein
MTDSETQITCQGCIEEQPNQLAHMSVGGCQEQPEDVFSSPLFSDIENEETIREEINTQPEKLIVLCNDNSMIGLDLRAEVVQLALDKLSEAEKNILKDALCRLLCKLI